MSEVPLYVEAETAYAWQAAALPYGGPRRGVISYWRGTHVGLVTLHPYVFFCSQVEASQCGGGRARVAIQCNQLINN